MNRTLEKLAKSRCYSACCSMTMEGCNNGIIARVCNFLPEIALAAGLKSDKWGVSF